MVNMPIMPPRRTPQFRVGDKVVVINPCPDKGEQGIVIQVSGGTWDFVYRYDVQFADGTSKRYFGFEIEFVLSQSA